MQETLEGLLAELTATETALQALSPDGASLEPFAVLLSRRGRILVEASGWLSAHPGTATVEHLLLLEQSRSAGNQSLRNLLVTRHRLATELAAAGTERRFVDAQTGIGSLGLDLQG
jgi:hypothetical protein